jgi:membrane protein YqaA with SNARE-associated domain
MTGILHAVEALADSPNAGWALFLVSFLESSFFPIPPDVLLMPLCLGDPELSFLFVAVCSGGSVIGGVAGYGIVSWGGRPLLGRLFSERKINVVQGDYERYNAWATGFAGLTPLPFKLFTLSGGAFAVNLKVFFFASLVSRSLRPFDNRSRLLLHGCGKRFQRSSSWLADDRLCYSPDRWLLIGRQKSAVGRPLWRTRSIMAPRQRLSNRYARGMKGKP